MKKITIKNKFDLSLRFIQALCLIFIGWFLIDPNFMDTVPNIYQTAVEFIGNFDLFEALRGGQPEDAANCINNLTK